MYPNTLADLQAYVEHDRREFYVDGDDNGIEWTVYNDVLHGRENRLYVDYIGRDCEYWWSDPAAFESLLQFPPTESPSLVMARTLHDVGVSDPDGLQAVATYWRGNVIAPDTSHMEIALMNRRTLELLHAPTGPSASWVADRWQFPMYDLDLTLIG